VLGVVFGFEAVVPEQIGVRKKFFDEVNRHEPGKGFGSLIVAMTSRWPESRLRKRSSTRRALL
jgi:hypothetical protein